VNAITPETVTTDTVDSLRDYNRKLLAQVPAERQLDTLVALQESVRNVVDPYSALNRQAVLLMLAVRK
jgi:hypothetical protein